MSNILLEPIDKIITLDKSKADALKRLELETVADLLIYRPLSLKKRKIYPNLSMLTHQDEVVVKAKVIEIIIPQKKSQPSKCFIGNETGGITIIFFKFTPYLKKIFTIGKEVIIGGKIELYDYRPQITHPEIFFDKAQITEYEPKYPLTYALTNSMIRSHIHKAISACTNVVEWIPDSLLKEYNISSFMDSVKSLHQYMDFSVPVEKALLRFKIDEALSNQLGFRYVREQTKSEDGREFKSNSDLQKQIIEKLGFELTQGQVDAIKDIEKDQASSNQMLRMIQGDVGCGKTIVAILTALNVISSGAQAAFMVPTDVLAQQHYNFATKLLSEFNINVALLTGKITGKKKEILLDSIKSGEVDLVIGTHSLFQEKVIFKDLGYIIVDEQHRFGVNQRMELVLKGDRPDVLIMSATPIPRTLSMTMFGDLAISYIKTKPLNRKDINTVVCSIKKLDDICIAVRNRIDRGEKVFWVCPLIEVDEQEELNMFVDVETRFSYLKNIFGDDVGFLHGGMASDEKSKIINQLLDSTIKILVSTTVIEVGVDIPDATLIIIENAEKFGLAQLHQLRGRVGRSNLESVCVMLYGKTSSKIAFERLKIMKESQDGFYISEKDLILRGEGELLGQKQSGDQNFKFLDISTDAQLINKCNFVASSMEITDNQILQMAIFNKQIKSNKIIC